MGLGREGSYSLQIKGEVLKAINSMISQFAKVIKSCHTEVLKKKKSILNLRSYKTLYAVV